MNAIWGAARGARRALFASTVFLMAALKPKDDVGLSSESRNAKILQFWQLIHRSHLDKVVNVVWIVESLCFCAHSCFPLNFNWCNPLLVARKNLSLLLYIPTRDHFGHLSGVPSIWEEFYGIAFVQIWLTILKAYKQDAGRHKRLQKPCSKNHPTIRR